MTSWLVCCNEILEVQGSINFPKIQNLYFCRQVGKNCNCYAENIRQQHTKFIFPGDRVLGICAPLWSSKYCNIIIIIIFSHKTYTSFFSNQFSLHIKNNENVRSTEIVRTPCNSICRC